jgi:hypothetical protein
MSPLAPTFSFPLLLALGFFFGLALEEFYARLTVIGLIALIDPHIRTARPDRGN